MKIESPDFRELLTLLNKNNVRYLVAGGYAVNFYGYIRNTGDIDIWIDNSEENADLVIQTLVEFGFTFPNLKKDDFIQPGGFIQLGYPPYRVDIITSVDGLTFNEAYENKKVETVDDIKINWISLEDLKKNKKASGRHKDLDDLEKLKKL